MQCVTCRGCNSGERQRVLLSTCRVGVSIQRGEAGGTTGLHYGEWVLSPSLSACDPDYMAWMVMPPGAPLHEGH
jgi:hypothetical protein